MAKKNPKTKKMKTKDKALMLMAVVTFLFVMGVPLYLASSYSINNMFLFRLLGYCFFFAAFLTSFLLIASKIYDESLAYIVFFASGIMFGYATYQIFFV